jgi:hypothetical protein
MPQCATSYRQTKDSPAFTSPHPRLAHAAGSQTQYCIGSPTQCKEGPVIWNWTRARTAMTLRTHPQYISEDYIIRPGFQYWQPQRHAAIVWIIAHFVTYRLQTQRRLSINDYVYFDFLKRARWKEYRRSSKPPTVGRYLEVL